jgi:hypothetical protein
MTVHVPEIAGNRDFLHRMDDFAALYPETCRAARIVTGRQVHALAHELGDDEPRIHLVEHALVVEGSRLERHVVGAARVARGHQIELARRVAVQKKPTEHAFGDEIAFRRGDPFRIEGRATQSTPQMGILHQTNRRRKERISQAIDEKRRPTIEIAAARCCQKMPD